MLDKLYAHFGYIHLHGKSFSTPATSSNTNNNDTSPRNNSSKQDKISKEERDNIKYIIFYLPITLCLMIKFMYVI
jgi:hypothetical protein